MKESKILIISTIFRVGEMTHPVIKELCKEYSVDILMLNQMSSKTPWEDGIDLRLDFYRRCREWGANVIVGPSHDESVRWSRNGKRLSRVIPCVDYKIVIIDDNRLKESWGGASVCRYLRSKGNVIVGCPHGNSEFNLYNLRNIIGDCLDFSFVFGEKEKNHLSDDRIREKLIPAGIPDNDRISGYDKRKDYILMTIGYSDTKEKNNKNGYRNFSEDIFIKSGALKLSETCGIDIIIKEKPRFKKNKRYSMKKLERYDNVSVILNCEDPHELICGARYNISSPTTMAFKSIQAGIPTVLLDGFGMNGNYYDFPGLSMLDEDSIISELYHQERSGICSGFIEGTLTGGLNFNSTEIYVENIKEIINGKRTF